MANGTAFQSQRKILETIIPVVVVKNVALEPDWFQISTLLLTTCGPLVRLAVSSRIKSVGFRVRGPGFESVCAVPGLDTSQE